MSRPICELPTIFVQYGHIARCPVCGQWWMKEPSDSPGSWYWKHMGWLRMHAMHRDVLRHLEAARKAVME